MEFFVDLPVPGINTAVADHFIMLFRDMADQTLDKFHNRNGFFHIFVILMTVVMKCDKIAVIAVNAAGAQAPKGHALIMNEYDVWALMSDFPQLEVIATHVEGVSHATVNRKLLADFAKNKGLSKLFIPQDLETLEF